MENCIKLKKQVVHKACNSKHEQLVHRRLGHFHKDAMKKLVKDDKNDKEQERILKEGNICSTCILGKMKNIPYPKERTDHVITVL